MAKKDFMGLMREKTVDVRPSLLSAEENIKSQLVILDQLRDLIPPLADDELAQLTQNILKHGVKDPLTIWETTKAIAGLGTDDAPAFVLIDGHNRYRVIQQHHVDFRINLIRFPSLSEVRDYMIDYQLGRRNLTAEQASYLRGMRYLQQKSARGSNLNVGASQRNVADRLGQEHGVSSRTIRRDGDFAAGLEKLAPDLKRKVLAGKQKLTKAVINSLTKADAQAPLTDVDAILAGSVAVSSSTESGPDEQPSPLPNRLRNEIRALANGRLTPLDCRKLQKKIAELLSCQTA